MEDESSDTGKQGSRIFGNWTPDDSKLLVITVGATVVANLITVMFVALAIIVARHSLQQPASVGDYAFFAGTGIFPALAIFSILWFFNHRRHDKRRDKGTDFTDRIIRWVLVIVGICEGFYALLYLLAWIGFAAGFR